jgi:hypothetical protein
MMNAWKRISDGGERGRGEEEWEREEIRDKGFSQLSSLLYRISYSTAPVLPPDNIHRYNIS